MDEFTLRLLNEFQRDFPLCPAPFAEIARQSGTSEHAVLRTLRRLHVRGVVSRVGVVFRANSIGASTLAAMALPESRLDEVAELVSSYAEVNHNYEREHRFNLWFVATAPDLARLQAVLDDIEETAGYPVMSLPMVAEYHIDLGFDLFGKDEGGRQIPSISLFSERGEGGISILHPSDAALVAAIQSGLPLVDRPYAEIGKQAGIVEAEVIGRLSRLLDAGVIKRIGIIVRHHELGYRANAMVVWDLPDDRVGEIGKSVSAKDFVTLCYRRPRQLPDWPYNFFCMIHGRDRATVLGHVEELRADCGLQDFEHEALFSRKRYKQCGACYAHTARVAHG